MHRTLIVAAVATSLAGPALAGGNRLEISGSVRARVEAIDGQFRPDAADAAALLLRTLIKLEYATGPLTFGGELQDSRVYVSRQPASIGTTEVDSVEPIQAYVAGKLADTARIQLGRMTMDLGSRRLISRQSFRNTTNAFAGVRLDWQPTKSESATLFWTMPQDRLPNDPDGIRGNEVQLNRERWQQQLFGARAATTSLIRGTSVEAYLYRLVERDAPSFATADRRLWTGGARMVKAPSTGKLDFEVEAAWQRGKRHASSRSADTADLLVRAWFVHASAGFSVDAPWSPRLIISYDRASGDGRAGAYGRFDTLFGARVFEFGPSSLYGPVGRANLSSPEARIEAKPSKRWEGYVAVRPLWLEESTDTFASTGLRDASGASGRYAGTQFDTRVRYWLNPDRVRIGAGAAALVKGEFLRSAPRAPRNGNTLFGYLEATYSF